MNVPLKYDVKWSLKAPEVTVENLNVLMYDFAKASKAGVPTMPSK
jgi:hypothetical protein